MVAKNVTPLVNDVVSVRIGTDTTIQVAGLDDIMTGIPNITELASKCQNEQYVIFMCHNPEIIPDAQLALDQKGETELVRSWTFRAYTWRAECYLERSFRYFSNCT